MRVSQIVQIAVIGVMLGAVVVKVVAQRRRGIRPIVFSGGWEVCMVTVFWGWFAMILVHGTGLRACWFGRAMIGSPALEWAGMALVAGGAALALAAFRSMGRAWRIGIDREVREKLITGGAFAISRNPIFLFFDLLAVGMVLMSPTPFFLISAPFVIAATHVQIRKEEQHLRETVGEEYERYCSRVNRYLGRRGSPASV